MFKFLTSKQKKFWKNRKIDWKSSYLDTWDHPHRELIVQVLKRFYWISIWEVGCGAGENLVKILRSNLGRNLSVGGSDVNEDAIKLARETFIEVTPNPDKTFTKRNIGKFHLESVEDMLISDRATDVVLSDATLIYIDPWKIRKVLHEMKRITRNRVILCEFQSENLIKRWLFRLKTGYNAYNYKKLLEDEGCYDVQLYKLPPEAWPGCQKGDGWFEFGTIITARI